VGRQANSRLPRSRPFVVFIFLCITPPATPGARKRPPRTPELARERIQGDGELAKRSHGNGLATTAVIVELRPGAAVPPSYRQFMRRNGKLGIINRPGLDLPEPDDRADVAASGHLPPGTSTANERVELPDVVDTGTRAVQKTLGLTARASAWRLSTRYRDLA